VDHQRASPTTKTQSLPRFVPFGVSEVNLRAGELRKDGVTLRSSVQPFQGWLSCWRVRAMWWRERRWIRVCRKVERASERKGPRHIEHGIASYKSLFSI